MFLGFTAAIGAHSISEEVAVDEEVENEEIVMTTLNGLPTVVASFFLSPRTSSPSAMHYN